MVRSRLYRNGKLVEEDFPITRLPEVLETPDTVVWLDLHAPDDHEIALVRDGLDLHELAVEDAFAEHQRPKLDRYPSGLFLTVYAVRYDDGLQKTEIDAFVTDRVLLTVRADEKFDVHELLRRWDSASELVNSGVGFLLHGLLDSVVDGHYAAAQQLDDDIEALEEDIFEEGPHIGRKVLKLRRSLVELRRVAMPMRDILGSLMNRDHGLVDDRLGPYFHDVKDHALFISEMTESMREMVTNLREAELNVQGNRLNLIMKKVTSWAAIIAVPTAISGFYGMNVPYPGYDKPSGFWVSTLGIVVLSIYLYSLFKRRDWL